MQSLTIFCESNDEFKFIIKSLYQMYLAIASFVKILPIGTNLDQITLLILYVGLSIQKHL